MAVRPAAAIGAFVLVACARRDPLAEVEARALEAGPAGARAVVEKVEDPAARAAVVLRLVEHDPARWASLCRALGSRAARRHCAQLARRPHLWVEPPPLRTVGGRAAPGPPGSTFLPRWEGPDPWADGPAMEPDCPRVREPHTCLTRRARAAAAAGRAEEAARACRGIEAGRWRQECRFEVAEEAVARRGAEGYADAVRLCRGAGPYEANCLTHLLVVLANGLPPGGGAPWERARGAAEAVAAAWADVDPTYGDLAVGRFWSEVVQRAVVRAPVLAGDLLDVLPSEAAPHVRASLAWALLGREREAGAGRDLAAWTARLVEVLHARAGRPPPPVRDRLFHEVRDLWPEDREGDERVPAVVYLGTSRRALADDEETDAAICVLEAAARARPPLWSVVRGARDDPRPLVAWTARRLVELAEREEAADPRIDRLRPPGWEAPPPPSGGAGGGPGRPAPPGGGAPEGG